MKLDKMKFARVIAHCVSNGMSAGEYEVNTLNDLIDVEVYQTDLDNLLMLMAEGTRKIDAIKAYRSLTGAGLKEAKEGVERHWVSKGHYQPEGVSTTSI